MNNIMTITQASEYSGINIRTLHYAVERGDIPRIKFDSLPINVVFVKRSDVDHFKANRPKRGRKKKSHN